MSKKAVKSQLELLQGQRKHTLKEIEHLEAELRTEIEHDDVDDSAQDLIERDKTYALIVTLKNKLNDINHAIERDFCAQRASESGRLPKPSSWL